MTARSKLWLIVFGVSLGLVAAFAVLKLWTGQNNTLPVTACTPAPGKWLAMVRALVHDYHDPCSEFYWHTDPNSEFHVRVRINNYGFHAPDYTLQKPPDVFRVLVVGDSFPQAIQVEIEQGFPYLVQEQLVRTSGKKIEVINLSVDAYGTDRELLLYAALGWQFQPDLVLLSFYTGNDVQDNEIDLETRRYGYRLDRPFFTLGEASKLELHGSPVFNPQQFPDSPAFQWLAELQAHQTPAPPENLPERPTVTTTSPQYELEYPVELGLYLPEDAHWSNAWNITESLLLQFRELVKLQNIPFAAIIIPDRRAVQAEDWSATLTSYGDTLLALRHADPTAPNSRLAKFFSDNSIPALDLTWTLRSWAQGKPGERLYFADDGHFNPNGHAVAAARIAEWPAGGKVDAVILLIMAWALG